MINWSIEATTHNLKYINTCAVDSILFSLYYMVNRFPVAMEYIETNVKTLYESIDLMKKRHVDMARIE